MVNNNEGSVWEAALFAVAKKLNNLTAIVDYNKWQGTGNSDEILALNLCMKNGKVLDGMWFLLMAIIIKN